MNNDINKGRLDYYYVLIAGLGALNLVYLMFCAKHYRYKNVLEKSIIKTNFRLPLQVFFSSIAEMDFVMVAELFS
ncbi:hypothetical protein JHK86_000391 [Glycine max]|nr:hypothetical protein JHK86_000391 [Glycine max]